MITESNQKLAAGLWFIDAAGHRVTVADLRRDARGVVLFFMRQASCMICLRHIKSLAGMSLTDRGIKSVVVVPGTAADAERVRRGAGTEVIVVSSAGAQAHNTIGLTKSMLMQHSGTLLIDVDDIVRYRRAATLPTGSFDRPELLAAIDQL